MEGAGKQQTSMIQSLSWTCTSKVSGGPAETAKEYMCHLDCLGQMHTCWVLAKGMVLLLTRGSVNAFIVAGNAERGLRCAARAPGHRLQVGGHKYRNKMHQGTCHTSDDLKLQDARLGVNADGRHKDVTCYMHACMA